MEEKQPRGVTNGSTAHDTLTPDVETSSDTYRARFSGEAGRFFLRTQAAAIDRLLVRGTARPDRPLRILEVGGGHGQITRGLLEQGHEVWVQGSAPCCIHQIRPLMNEFQERLHFVCSTMWALPFAPCSFDAVIALRVMAHVERWRALLAEMGRVSKRQVLLDYASLASVNVLTPLVFRLKRRVEGNTRPYFCTTAGRLTRALRGLGFARFSLEKQFLLPMGLHRAAGSTRFLVAVERVGRAIGMTRLLGSPVILLAEKPVDANAEDSRGHSRNTEI